MDPIESDQHRRRLHLRPDAGGAAPRPRAVALRGAPHGAARRRQAPGRAPRGAPAGPRPPRHASSASAAPTTRSASSTLLDLATMDVVLMRQDPPFDMAYITATHLLEHIHPKTLVVNDPAAVRNAPEKLFVTHFPELMPPTLITWDLEAIRAFRARARGHHPQAAVRQRRRRRVPHQAGRREPRRAAGDALRRARASR